MVVATVRAGSGKRTGKKRAGADAAKRKAAPIAAAVERKPANAAPRKPIALDPRKFHASAFALQRMLDDAKLREGEREIMLAGCSSPYTVERELPEALDQAIFQAEEIVAVHATSAMRDRGESAEAPAAPAIQSGRGADVPDDPFYTAMRHIVLARKAVDSLEVSKKLILDNPNDEPMLALCSVQADLEIITRLLADLSALHLTGGFAHVSRKVETIPTEIARRMFQYASLIVRDGIGELSREQVRKSGMMEKLGEVMTWIQDAGDEQDENLKKIMAKKSAAIRARKAGAA